MNDSIVTSIPIVQMRVHIWQEKCWYHGNTSWMARNSGNANMKEAKKVSFFTGALKNPLIRERLTKRLPSDGTGGCRLNFFFVSFYITSLVNIFIHTCSRNNFAKLRRCMSRVQLAKIHFGRVQTKNWSQKAPGHKKRVGKKARKKPYKLSRLDYIISLIPSCRPF